MEIKRGKQPGPRRILLYGKHGIGKSTWAAAAPSPLFLNIEDGLADIDCDKTDPLKTFSEFMDSLVWLDGQKHKYRTVVIDTVDWVEQLIHDRVCEENGVKAIADIDYGKGPGKALPRWKMVINWLDQLRTKRRMGVILLSHASPLKAKNPGEESYDCWGPAIDHGASELLQEWCDEVLYARTRVFTKQEDLGFKKTRAIAIGGEERFVQCTASASANAKNRLGLPNELPFSWPEYATYFTKASKSEQVVEPTAEIEPAGNVAGLVVDGTSKVSA
jgi:hypothetical protein